MLLIYLICFLDLLSLGLLLPVAPVHLTSIGASRFLIGSLTSLHAFLQLSSGPLLGSLSDTKGRKPLLIQSLFLILISNLLLLFTSSLTIYIISRIIFGLSGHVQILLKALVVTGVPKTKQNDAFAMMGAMAGLSFVIGPILGSVINSTEGGFFKLALLLNILAVINLGISFLLSDTKPKKTSDKSKEKSVLLQLTQAFINLSNINWDVFWDVFAFKFLAESGFAAFFTTFGIILMGQLGATQKEMGVIISLFSVTMIIINLSIGKINAKFYVSDSTGFRRTLHAFIGLIFTFALLYLHTTIWMYVVVLIGMGAFRGILDTTWSEMLVHRTKDSEKGLIMGSFESVMQMANLFTPIIVTYVGEMYGYTQTYIIVMGFITFGAFISAYRLISSPSRIKAD